MSKDHISQAKAAAAALKKHADRSDVAGQVRGALTMASSDPRVRVEFAELDHDPWVLNVRNGIVDLKTGTLLPHDKSKLLTRMAPVDYDPNATCPTWCTFLDTIFGGDKALISYVQTAIGYSLTGRTNEQVAFVLFGEGANGKTTLMKTFQEILGDYSWEMDNAALVAKRFASSGPTPELAALRGRRLVTANELPMGMQLDEARLKQMTGDDRIACRGLYQDQIEFSPIHKIWIRTNHLPQIKGTDTGIWRRIRVIPFNVQIDEDQKDIELPDRLRIEYSGILAWAVQGCLDWQRSRLMTPPSVQEETQTYRSSSDSVLAFHRAEPIFEGFFDQEHQASDLYDFYKGWCKDNEARPVSQTLFSLRLPRFGWQKRHSYHGNCWSRVDTTPIEDNEI